MKGLFLKIFGWFWLTIIITITATYWISSKVFEAETQSSRLEQVIDHYMQEIEREFTTQAISDFLDWLQARRFPRGIGITLMDEQGSIIAAKGVPEPVLHFIQQHNTWPLNANRHGIQQKWIDAEKKMQLSVVFFPRKKHLGPDHPDPWFSNFNKRTRGGGLLRLMIALTISAAVCYLLARYLSRPITKLRNTVKNLGKGNFETDVAAQFANRNDEISELATDIDEMAGKLREQFKQREDLLRDISHELRSPLARMRISSELIKSNAGASERRQINQLESDIALIDKLIGEIITFSRLSDHNRQLDFSCVDIRALLDEILANANFEAKSQHKKVLLTSESEAVYRIKANQALIQSALENVIRNAIKYTPANTAVTVALRNQPGLITVVITDQGDGVDHDQLENIFEPFYRVSDSRSRESGGAGLGLAIARRAIDLHQGNISACNAEPGGLSITITLPASQK